MTDSSASAASEWRNWWFLPVIAALGYATSMIHIYSLGAFLEPLQTAFGWKRAAISEGVTIAALVNAVVCIPMGLLVDRIGPRRMALTGVVLTVGAYALMSTATGTLANWRLLWVVIAVGTFAIQTPVWTSAVASRFEKSRGLALAIVLCGGSVASAIFPVVATKLIALYGWRHTYVILGGLWLVLVLPLILLWFRGAQDGGRVLRAEEFNPKKALSGMALSDGFRSLVLYKLLLAGGLVAFVGMGVLVHFIPILTGNGVVRDKAAWIASLIGIFSIIGRLGAGVLLDYCQGHKVGALAVLFPIVGCFLLLFAGFNPVGQIAAAICFGFALGSEIDVVAYLASRHFGLKNFGGLYGALVTALALGTAFGPYAAGFAYDHFKSYQQFLVLSVGFMAISALAFISLGPAPARAAEIGAA